MEIYGFESQFKYIRTRNWLNKQREIYEGKNIITLFNVYKKKGNYAKNENKYLLFLTRTLYFIGINIYEDPCVMSIKKCHLDKV